MLSHVSRILGAEALTSTHMPPAPGLGRSGWSAGSRPRGLHGRAPHRQGLPAQLMSPPSACSRRSQQANGSLPSTTAATEPPAVQPPAAPPCNEAQAALAQPSVCTLHVPVGLRRTRLVSLGAAADAAFDAHRMSQSRTTVVRMTNPWPAPCNSRTHLRAAQHVCSACVAGSATDVACQLRPRPDRRQARRLVASRRPTQPPPVAGIAPSAGRAASASTRHC